MSMNYYNVIIDFLSAIITLYLEILVFNKISDGEKVKINFKFLIILTICSIMLLLNTYYVDSLSRSFMSIIIVYVCILLVSNKGVINSFIYLIICNIFIAFYEIVFSSILVKINIISLEMFDSNHLIKAIFSIILLLFVYITTSNNKVRELLNRIINTKTKTFNMIIAILLVSFCFSLIIMNFNYVDSISYKVYISNAILLLCITIIIAISIYSYVKVEKEEQKTELLLNFMSKYEKVIEENRISNHELLNTLLVLKTYNKNTDEYDILLNELIDKYNNKGIKIKNIHNLPPGLKGIFYYKLHGLDDHKYEININVSKKSVKNIKKISSNDYMTLYKIIGIILDNAIEAASSSKKKYILIDVYDESNTIIFEISNSYTGKMNLESINIKGYSTKGNKRGLGLYIMNNLLIKCNNIKVEQTVNNRVHIFNTKILVNKK